MDYLISIAEVHATGPTAITRLFGPVWDFKGAPHWVGPIYDNLYDRFIVSPPDIELSAVDIKGTVYLGGSDGDPNAADICGAPLTDLFLDLRDSLVAAWITKLCVAMAEVDQQDWMEAIAIQRKLFRVTWAEEYNLHRDLKELYFRLLKTSSVPAVTA